MTTRRQQILKLRDERKSLVSKHKRRTDLDYVLCRKMLRQLKAEIRSDRHGISNNH